MRFRGECGARTAPAGSMQAHPASASPAQGTWSARLARRVGFDLAGEGPERAAALSGIRDARSVSNPQTSNAERAEMGITARDTSPLPEPLPAMPPLALVESGQRLTLQLRPGAAPRSEPDESTPARRARPAGVLGAEVWVKLVDADEPAPTNPAALVFLTMTTKPTFRAEFKPGEGGKTAVYMARWINTRGEKGPWSEIATATVAA